MISQNKRTDQQPINEESQILDPAKTKIMLEWFNKINPKPKDPSPPPPKQLVQQDYESILKSGESAYNYQFKFDQPILVLQKKLICSHRLDSERFDNSEENIAFYVALKKVEEIYDNIITLIDSGEDVLHIRGSSGVGKTWALVLSTLLLKYAKKQQVRIIHVILSGYYMLNFYRYFLQDLVYAFALEKDENIGKIPNSEKSTLKEWYSYLKCINYDNFKSFLEACIKYYETKGIKVLMIWDGDNHYWRMNTGINRKTQFISDIRVGDFANFKVICASDGSYDFKKLKESDCILQINEGFTKEQTENYLREDSIQKKIKFSLTDDEITKIFEISQGNGFLLKQFIDAQPKVSDFENKCAEFLKIANRKCKYLVMEFYQRQVKEDKENWIKAFPNILLCLNSKTVTIPDHLHKYIDRNNMFLEKVENEYFLRSVSQISEFQVQHIYTSMSVDEGSENLLKDKTRNLLKLEKDGSMKGKYFERYVFLSLKTKLKEIKSFAMNKFKYKNKNSQEMSFQFPYQDCCHTYSSFDELKDLLKTKEDGIFIPFSSTNPDFDLLIFQYDVNTEELFLYPMQISINISGHKASDKLFFQRNPVYLKLCELYKEKINWQFIWVTGDENYTAEEFFTTKVGHRLKFDVNNSWFCPLAGQIWSY